MSSIEDDLFIIKQYRHLIMIDLICSWLKLLIINKVANCFKKAVV